MSFTSKRTTQNPSKLNNLMMELNAALAKVANAQKTLDEFNALPENNVYPTIQDALSDIEIDLLDQAEADCEGAYNFGNEEYTQLFMVDSKTYLATLTVDYNRYNKKYYYIDASEISYKDV